MPLFDRNRPTKNPKKYSKNLKYTNVGIAGDSTVGDVIFGNAEPSPNNFIKIKENLEDTITDNISVSYHPSLSSGRIIKFFNGEPQNIDLEQPTGNSGGDCEFSPEGFLSERDCIVSYMFAHLVPKRRSKGGFRKISPEPTNEIPYSPEIGTIEPEDADLPFQVVFVEQDSINNEIIKISSSRLQHRNNSSGVSVIRNEVINIDTWYNGRFENFNVGNNVSIGYLSDNDFVWDIGDRYNWTYGSINFTSNIASEWTGESCIISGGYLDTSDCEDTIIVECSSKIIETNCPPTSSSPTSSQPTSSQPTSSCPTSSSPTSSCPTSSQPSSSNDPTCYDTISECKSVIIPFDPNECGVWVPTVIPDPDKVIIYDGEITGEESVIKETVNGTEVKAIYTENSIRLIAWKFFVFSIGTDNDPYKEIHPNTDFKDSDANISAPLKVNYFDKEFGKARYISRLKQLTEGNGISIKENSRNNLVIAKK